MKRYQTIIWDLDGTLLDTLEDLCDSVNEALSVFNLPIKTKKQIRSYVGNGILRLIELAVPDGKHHPHFEEIYGFFKQHYAENCCNKTKPYEGIESILNRLKKCGIQMAIVSNKVDSAVKDLAKIHFKDTISVAIGETEGMEKKPAPDSVFAAMALLGATPDSTVYIGDSEVDVATAANAGIDGLCVSWGFRDKSDLQAVKPAFIADTLAELEDYLNQRA